MVLTMVLKMLLIFFTNFLTVQKHSVIVVVSDKGMAVMVVVRKSHMNYVRIKCLQLCLFLNEFPYFWKFLYCFISYTQNTHTFCGFKLQKRCRKYIDLHRAKFCASVTTKFNHVLEILKAK